MFNKTNLLRLLVLLIIFSFVITIIGSRGCPKRNDRTRGGSSYLWFGIAAPSNLVATAVSSYQINLSWNDNSNNEDGFAIERKIDGYEIWDLIDTVGAGVTVYEDTTVYPSNRYYYRVRAFNSINDFSDYSNEIEVYSLGFKTAIKVSGSYSLAITIDGTIWGWGDNTNLQLGFGDTVDRPVPTRIGNDSDWSTIVAAGGFSGIHTIAIKNNGTIWAWGSNMYGQLGIGDTSSDAQIPFQIGSDSDWFTIATGSSHSIALKTDGSLWGWGYNGVGQLGLGDTNNQPSPTRIGTNTNWSAISANGDSLQDYNIALQTNGTIWGWGYNAQYQLGLGESDDKDTPTRLGTASDWNLINTGRYHAIVRKTTGIIWVWGYNGGGQLGVGDVFNRNTPAQMGTDTDWYAVASGYAHTIAVKNNGTIWGWGENSYGQLGLGYTNSSIMSPVQIGTDSDWSAITAGFRHNIALKTNGTLWVWGNNDNDQLGLGDKNNRNIPTQLRFGILINPPVSLIANLAMGDSSRIDLSWIDISDNEDGFKIERKIGINGTWSEIGDVGIDVISYSDNIEILPFTTYYYRVRPYNIYGDGKYSNEAAVASSGNWTSVTAGLTHNLGLTTNYSIWSWGNNQSGQLGLGDSGDGTERTTPTQLTTETDWSIITAGESHSVALKTTGTLWAWGGNQQGQLGLGNTNAKNTPSRIESGSDWFKVSAGGQHTIALKTNRTLWVWGGNRRGQLGLGNKGLGTDRTTPTKLDTNSDWSLVVGGGSNSIALKTNRTIWGWGLNNYGQLGLGDTGDKNTPVQIGNDTDWSFATAGSSYIIAVKSDNTLWGWGSNGGYELGLDDTTNRETPSQIGSDSDWIAVVTKINHTIARKTDGTIWVWGNNSFGQLGLGYAIFSVSIPTQVDFSLDWFSIAAGNEHTIATRTNGTMWTWGKNDRGQLGLGDTNNRNIPTLAGE